MIRSLLLKGRGDCVRETDTLDGAEPFLEALFDEG
jgi:hypothetical protein